VTTRALLTGDGDGGLERILCGGGVCRIATQIDVTAQTMEVCVEQMTANLLGDHQSLADKCQCVVKIESGGLKFRKQHVIKERSAFIAVSYMSRQFSLDRNGSGFWID
jgi:hypothetical protein